MLVLLVLLTIQILLMLPRVVQMAWISPPSPSSPCQSWDAGSRRVILHRYVSGKYVVLVIIVIEIEGKRGHERKNKYLCSFENETRSLTKNFRRSKKKKKKKKKNQYKIKNLN